VRQNTRRALGCGAIFSATAVTLAAGPAAAQTAIDEAPAALPAPLPAVAPAHATLAVTSVRRTVLEGRSLVVRGRLKPVGAGRVVALQLSTPRGRWQTVDHDRTDRAGRYLLRWRAAHTGTRLVRVRFAGDTALGATRRIAGRTRIYRQALASWYGPGLYGAHLACGGRLTAGTLGVAHKWLPCGTPVTLHYRGRTIRVPVVDRGPYVGAREFDLTAATRDRLRFGGTGIVLTTRS
jgi:hypothetical protein